MIKRCKRCEKLFDGSGRQIYCPNCAKTNRAVNERASRISQQRAIAYNLLSEEPCENVYHGRMSEEERLCMIEKQKKFREARLKSESPRRTYEEKGKL